jgi:hypothetical protein
MDMEKDLVANKEKILEKVQELGQLYEPIFTGCAQNSLLACMEVYGKIDENLYKAASGFSGGLGCSAESQCGALTGGLLFLGTLFGRGFAGRGTDYYSGMTAKSFDLAQKLKAKFEAEYGGFTCLKVQEGILGRGYKLDRAEEGAAFGAASDGMKKCGIVVGLGARWALELAIEELEKCPDPATCLLYSVKKDQEEFNRNHVK